MFQHFLAFQGTSERIDFLLFTFIRTLPPPKKKSTRKLGQVALLTSAYIVKRACYSFGITF